VKFAIEAVDRSLEPALQAKVDQKTKPLGALGALESLAVQIGLVQQSLEPRLQRPVIGVFAADHGIAEEGVSAYPQAVTGQMVQNFLDGGAAINVLARQHGITLEVVDAGIREPLLDKPKLVDARIAAGTRNSCREPAMAPEQCREALSAGASLVTGWCRAGTNVAGFGEMGIGNTSPAALLTALFTGLPLERCVGRGTGLDAAALAAKQDALSRALSRSRLTPDKARADPLRAMSELGGFEIAMMCGGMLRAAELRALVLVDGFIATSAFLAARALVPAVTDYAVLTHRSAERGHRAALDVLGQPPLLSLGMRLGEGTGAALAYPILESAVRLLNEMASFSEAGVSERS